KVKSFTYVAEDNSLYQLNKNEDFLKVEFEKFENILVSQKLAHHPNLDDLFEPSDYLVSPFNNSERFINGSYFLTQQQQEFKNSILKSPATFTIIEGLPGTGKTLLLYDLAKELNKDHNILIIHTGTLNTGHMVLNQQFKWDIIPVKSYERISHFQPSIIFVDETQRMKPPQLEYIIKYVIEHDIFCIFSIDPKQILALREWNYDNKSTLMTLADKEVYKLSKKIRTNKELAAFIKGLFNLNHMKFCNNTDNISIHYFDGIDEARGFAEGLENEGWQVIDYTGENWNGHLIDKMKLHRGLNAHGVLGQEFEKVLVLVGSTFYYGEEGDLSVRGKNHYDPERMFYQSVTRARKQIMLLIVDNPKFMTKLLNAVSNNKVSS
ncbi:DNA/RNA helicase domain-containing protein, partial [Rossellomorea marisflavi]|uniref:DNA/RNA helicase domain-containing protein n=1 Tax=Rossellomorea marisflavi TaxID=189381 RepID=UPI00295E402D